MAVKHQWWCGGQEPCACTEGWKQEQSEVDEGRLDPARVQSEDVREGIGSATGTSSSSSRSAPEAREDKALKGLEVAASGSPEPETP
jgi:hypothetical protein